jgi:hypothetical protein
MVTEDGAAQPLLPPEPLLADVAVLGLLEHAATAMAVADKMIGIHRLDGLKPVGFVIEPHSSVPDVRTEPRNLAVAATRYVG